MSANQPDMTIVQALRDLPLDEDSLTLLLEISFQCQAPERMYGEDAVRVLSSEAGRKLLAKYRLIEKFFEPQFGPSVKLTNEGWVVAEQLKTRAVTKRLNFAELDTLFTFQLFSFGQAVHVDQLRAMLLDERSWSSVNTLVAKGALHQTPGDLSRYLLTPLGTAFTHEARRQIEVLIGEKTPAFDHSADKEILKSQIVDVLNEFVRQNQNLPELSPFESLLRP